MCFLLDVSAAGYYESRKRIESARTRANAELTRAICAVHSESRGTHGRFRVHAELVDRGFPVGVNRIGRLMKAAKIAGISPRRFRKTTDSDHALQIAENVVARTFDVDVIGAKNRIWAGDITYLQTREGWLYLAVVIDLASRRVIGWLMDFRIDRALVIRAVRAAIKVRRPGAGTIFHSDRGSQYASNEFRAVLRANGLQQSMSGKGECWDNAVVESFFGTMKTELRDPIWVSREAARAAIFDYIVTWYNRKRRHSTLGYLSPEQYESKLPNVA